MNMAVAVEVITLSGVDNCQVLDFTTSNYSQGSLTVTNLANTAKTHIRKVSQEICQRPLC